MMHIYFLIKLHNIGILKQKNIMIEFNYSILYFYLEGRNMIKNRTTQLIYQTVYCTIGLLGVIACFGIFDDISNFR